MPFALHVGVALASASALGILSTNSRSAPGLRTSHTVADAALAQGLDQLVALDDLGLLLLGLGGRRRGACGWRLDGRLEQRRGDGPERGEPDVEHRQLAGADGAGDEGGDARRVLGRGARERVVGVASVAGWSAFTGSASAACRRSPASTRSMHSASRSGLRARRLAEVCERVGEAESARELGVVGVQRGERLGAPARPSRRRRRPTTPRCAAPRPARSIGRARPRPSSAARWRAAAASRAIDHERPPGREGAEPAHVVHLAERRAARRVDEAPEERRERTLQRPGQLARAVGEALELAEPQAGVVGRRPAAGAMPRPRRRRRARSRRGGSRAPRARAPRARRARRDAAPARDRGSRPGRGPASSTSPRARARRRARPRRASRAAAPRGAARTRARSLERVDGRGALRARRPSPSAMRRASWKVGASDAAKRAARASASSSSYCAARRTRFSRPSSRSSGSRSAPSSTSVTAITSIQRRASSSARASRARAMLAQRAERPFDLRILGARAATASRGRGRARARRSRRRRPRARASRGDPRASGARRTGTASPRRPPRAPTRPRRATR